MSRHHTLQHVITDEQEANLRKGAEGLMNLPPERPFDMKFYREDCSYPAEFHHCETAACALGYFPMWVPAQEREDWAVYSLRVTGRSEFGGAGDFDYWDWCFSTSWSSTDNTPQGAARRILHLLDNGLPDDWWEQVDGNAPYIFAEATS